MIGSRRGHLLGILDDRRPAAVIAVASLVAALLAGGLFPGSPGGLAAVRAAGQPTRIVMSAPTTIDPAAAGDADSSAVIAQLFEGLTVLDSNRAAQPALAASWAFSDGGKTIRFTLRAGLQFSDGSPLTSADVVRSWLRVLDPAKPSPLAGLLFDIVGARAYTTAGGPASGLGISAPDASTVEVRLDRPALDFPALVSSPTMAVAPPGVGRDPAALQPGSGFVASGGYRLTGATPAELDLTANTHYWAGTPAITDVALVSDLGETTSEVAFQAGSIDWVPVGGGDAAWLAWDPTFGPSLRRWDDLSLSYFGFNTRTAPFSDVRVRQAFAQSVDWRRLVRLSGASVAEPATSMVPPGIAGRPTEDLQPTFDPAAARGLLAAAGYQDPSTFPTVTLVVGCARPLVCGSGYDLALADQLKTNLGVVIRIEGMDDGPFYARMSGSESPAFWAMGWSADYPSPNDFLGIILGTGEASNFGGWSNAGFDAAIDAATSATDPAAAAAAYDAASQIVRDQVPVVPLAYGPRYALVRQGLLGAGANGMGPLWIAGMAWAPGSGR